MCILLPQKEEIYILKRTFYHFRIQSSTLDFLQLICSDVCSSLSHLKLFQDQNPYHLISLIYFGLTIYLNLFGLFIPHLLLIMAAVIIHSWFIHSTVSSLHPNSDLSLAQHTYSFLGIPIYCFTST